MAEAQRLTDSEKLNEIKTSGFRDGFMGVSARAVSPSHEWQVAYFDSFSEGREHRRRVDRVCENESLSLNEAMRKAFDFYYKSRYIESNGEPR